MDIHFVPPALRRLDELKTEGLALSIFSDVRPLTGALVLADWRLCGLVSRLLLEGQFEGRLGERVLIPTRPRMTFDKLFLFGAGPLGELDEARFVEVVDHMFATLSRARVRAFALGLPGRSLERPSAVRAMELFLERAAEHADHDRVILIEAPAAQRVMLPVLERERRRMRARQSEAPCPT